LFFYNPSGMSMPALRAFEFFVICLVLGVVICFCYELSKIKDTTVGEVFRGYLPSSAIIQPKGLYQSCGILGATVMPHSLYLGSGIVQSRLRDFDEHYQAERQSGTISSPSGPSASTTADMLTPRRTISNMIVSDSSSDLPKYRPSLAAIRSCLNYSITELALSLFTFALFVNSAILIVSGASLSSLPEDQTDNADLFAIHNLLSTSIAPAAGTIFALALLLSGTSAGIVCTIAGQMVSEGQLNWRVRPWLRRLVTRSISIVPSIIIAGAVGRAGLSDALEASQVALSVILPFVSAPLLWFTFSAKVMTVAVDNSTTSNDAAGGEAASVDHEAVHADSVVVMRNGWFTNLVAGVIWLILVVMNVALLVLVGKGV
jgi:metal iron transporter